MMAFDTPGLGGEQRLGGFGQVEILAHRFTHEAQLMKIHGARAVQVVI